MRKIIIEADCGESIQDYANRVISRFRSVARTNNSSDFEIDCGEFNGVKLHCNKDTTVASFIEHFNNVMAENARKYRESDEYQKIKIENALKIQEMQEKALLMEAGFEDINKRDYKTVLKWLKEYQPLTDRIGVITNRNMILNRLEEAGYYDDMNIGERFNREDEGNVAEYIIGQCMSCLNGTGSIHGVVNGFVDEWIAKFDK